MAEWVEQGAIHIIDGIPFCYGQSMLVAHEVDGSRAADMTAEGTTDQTQMLVHGGTHFDL